MRQSARGFAPAAMWAARSARDWMGPPADCGMDIRLPLHIEQTYYPEIPLADTAPFLRAPHGQSPNTACQTASAASAAVSARMIRGPRLTGRTKAAALIAA